MKNKDFAIEWLKRAEGSFLKAKKGKTSRKEYYEDYCYDCQQTAEKALKAILIFHNTPYERTHSIGRLLELIEKTGITIPTVIKKSDELTLYASDTRYPGDYEPVTNKEYKQALKLAEKVLQWTKLITQQKSTENLF